jgi:protein TonB
VERPTARSRERRGLGSIARGRLDWAQGLYEAGRYGEASVAVKEVFKLAPADPEARQLAGKIQAALVERAALAAQPPGESSGSPLAAPPATVPHSRGDSPGSPSKEYPGWVRVNPPPRSEAAPEQDPPGLEELKAAPAVDPQPAVLLGALVKLGEPGVVAPVPESRPELRYPDAALLQQAEGSVELRALVDETGVVTDALVVGGPDGQLGFKEAAVEYVKRWRYVPARKDGVPVKVWVPAQVDFRLPR